MLISGISRVFLINVLDAHHFVRVELCRSEYIKKEYFGQMRISCLIRRLTKRWNSRRTWKICYVFNFQLKKIRSKIIQITLIELWSFISFELRHLNSMKMSQKAKFGCSIFQLKIKRKQIFQVRHQFGHFVKCRIWHEKHTNYWKLSKIWVMSKLKNPTLNSISVQVHHSRIITLN